MRYASSKLELSDGTGWNEIVPTAASVGLAINSGLVGNYDYESDPNAITNGYWNNSASGGTQAPSATKWGSPSVASIAGIAGYRANGAGFDISVSNGWWTSTTFTIQYWGYLHGYNSYNTGIVSQYTGGGRHNWMWTNNGQFHMNGCKGSAYAGNNGGTGIWRLLTLRYDNGYRYDIDNLNYQTTVLTGAGNMCTSSTNIAIGARNDHVEAANITVRKVVFYNRYISDAELTTNWNLYRTYVGR
jgi:hypothetical protein